MTWHWVNSKGQCVSSPSSPESVADSLPANFFGGGPEAESKSTSFALGACFKGREKGISSASRSGMTSEPSTAEPGLMKWKSSQVASLAKISRAREGARVWRAIAQASGLRCSESLARYGLAMSSPKIPRTFEVEAWERSSQALPQWGMMLNGVCLELGSSVRRIDGTAAGLLLPTPTGAGNENSPSMLKWSAHRALRAMVPTPMAKAGGTNKGGGGNRKQHIERPSLERLTGGINYIFREWLLAWPAGWSGPKPLEMAKYQEWLRSHGISSGERNSMNAKHLSKSVRYGTPKNIVEASREAMGSIDLDPATSKLFNELHIKAKKIYTAKTNGLTKKWRGNVILNPPGGKVDEDGNPVNPKAFGYSSAAFWFDKLMDQVEKGHTKKAIFVAFSMELLQVVQQHHNLEGCHICIPSSRLAFLDHDGTPLTQPTHANAVIGIAIDGHVFNQAFKKIGFCATVRTKL